MQVESGKALKCLPHGRVVMSFLDLLRWQPAALLRIKPENIRLFPLA